MEAIIGFILKTVLAVYYMSITIKVRGWYIFYCSKKKKCFEAKPIKSTKETLLREGNKHVRDPPSLFLAFTYRAKLSSSLKTTKTEPSSIV